jgi:transposase
VLDLLEDPSAEALVTWLARYPGAQVICHDRDGVFASAARRGFFALPEAMILRSLPGIGPRLAACIAVEIGSISCFRTPSHLAAYAGLGPTPWRSGTSINSNVPSRFGNHRLRTPWFWAAFDSLRHEPSRSYYDRKRAQGKRHNQAVLCLARRPGA